MIQGAPEQNSSRASKVFFCVLSLCTIGASVGPSVVSSLLAYSKLALVRVRLLPQSTQASHLLSEILKRERNRHIWIFFPADSPHLAIDVDEQGNGRRTFQEGLPSSKTAAGKSRQATHDFGSLSVQPNNWQIVKSMIRWTSIRMIQWSSGRPPSVQDAAEGRANRPEWNHNCTIRACITSL
jgi:hypothetical protein